MKDRYYRKYSFSDVNRGFVSLTYTQLECIQSLVTLDNLVLEVF